jgi:dTDP-4-dehydrorhamnose reductase
VRVLVLGSDTPLGQALQEFLDGTGRHDVVTLSRAGCRWKSERQAKKAVQRAACQMLVDLRISATLDAGQTIPGRDIEACGWLAKACQRHGCAYLYLSSCSLFSGKLDRLYAEVDVPDCDHEPGQVLLEAERAVADRCERHLILRLGPVFSHRRDNWLPQAMLQIQGGGAWVPGGHSVAGTPVAAGDAARVISALLDQLSAGAEAWGIYHYASADKVRAEEVAEVLLAAASQFFEFDPGGPELDALQGEQGRPGPALDCRKIRNTFAIKQVPWRDALTATVKQYFKSAQ